MSRTVLCLALLSSLTFAQTKSAPAATPAATPAAKPAPAPQAPKPLTLDDGTTITAFDEMPGREMDAELFEGGPLTKEQRLAYMPGGKAPAAVNVFLVKTGGKTYLVDAGFGNALRDKRVDPSKIDAVFITHEHGDHVGGLLKEDGTPAFSAPVFVSKKEREYWGDAKTPNSETQKNIAKAYGERIKTFNFGDTLAPGVVAVDAAGHTPGHTAFLVGAGKKKLLIAGDFLHAAALQFPNPEECAKFDIDRKKSAEVRKKIIKMSVDNGWLLGGIHIPSPGYGSAQVRGFDFTLGK